LDDWFFAPAPGSVNAWVDGSSAGVRTNCSRSKNALGKTPGRECCGAVGQAE